MPTLSGASGPDACSSRTSAPMAAAGAVPLAGGGLTVGLFRGGIRDSSNTQNDLVAGFQCRGHDFRVSCHRTGRSRTKTGSSFPCAFRIQTPSACPSDWGVRRSSGIPESCCCDAERGLPSGSRARFSSPAEAEPGFRLSAFRPYLPHFRPQLVVAHRPAVRRLDRIAHAFWNIALRSPHPSGTRPPRSHPHGTIPPGHGLSPSRPVARSRLSARHDLRAARIS